MPLTWALLTTVTMCHAQQRPNPLHFGERVPAGAVAIINGQTISEAEFIDELAAVHLRPAGEGGAVLRSLIDAKLVEQGMSLRGWSVTEADVDQKIQELDAGYRQSQNKSLEEALSASGVSMEVFRSRMKQVVALERLARADLQVPQSKPVENLHMRTWLKSKREVSQIETDRALIPSNAVATVAGIPVPKKDFVQSLLLTLKPMRTAKTIENLLHAALVHQMLNQRGTQVTPQDITAEWEHRKAGFMRNPIYKDIRYEEIVEQQTGLTPAQIQASRAFRANAGIGKLARSSFDQATLQQAYQENLSRYGPVLHVRHILVAASDAAFQRNQGVRSIEEGSKLANYIRSELIKGLSFDDATRAYSDDTGTKLKGGVIPPFAPGRNAFEEKFVAGALQLQVLELSQPIRTDAGWHLIRLDRKDPAPPLSDQHVESDLRRFLADRMVAEAYKKATIGIDMRL